MHSIFYLSFIIVFTECENKSQLNRLECQGVKKEKKQDELSQLVDVENRLGDNNHALHLQIIAIYR